MKGHGVAHHHLHHPHHHAGLTLSDLASASEAIGLGVVAGLAVGVVVRRMGFRWTVGLAALPLVPLGLAINPIAVIATACFTVGVVAPGFGAEWQARERGGAEAKLERERPGLLSVISGRLRSSRAKRDRVDGERLAIGISNARKVVRVPLGRTQGRHGLILGATGAGKTVTEAAIAQWHLRSGNAVIAIDPKGDRFLARTLQREAGTQGVPFRAFTPNGPCVYNVAARGGRSEVADKLLSGHQWSEPHYLAIALRFMQREVEVLRAAGIKPSLASISRYLHPERLEAVAAGADAQVGEQVATLVDDMPKRMLDDLAGARSRIALLAESEFGRWLDPNGGESREIDLEQVIANRGVAYFWLEADRYPELARLLATALIVDLITLSADLQAGALRAALVIDEFASIAGDHVARLFATARTAGVSTILATQGLADLQLARGDNGAEDLRGQVLQNLEFLISHRQSDPESAELLAELAGTHADYTITRKVEGSWFPSASTAGSRIPTRSFNVHPDEFKTLGVGEAVVMELGREGSPQVARIWPPEADQ
jgi:hypothetical protein